MDIEERILSELKDIYVLLDQNGIPKFSVREKTRQDRAFQVLKGKDIVTLGMVSKIFITQDKVFFSLLLPVKDEMRYEDLRKKVEERIQKILPKYNIHVSMTFEQDNRQQNLVKNTIASKSLGDTMATLGNFAQRNLTKHNPPPFHPKTAEFSKTIHSFPMKCVLAIASGKGGVGKSTTALNLALALKECGLRIGLLDADIYGPSLARLTGLNTAKVTIKKDKSLIPLEKFGLKLMSMGFFLEEGKAVIWRGPMIITALKQMLHDVSWGEIDILIVDMPPGTGDIALSLAQQVPCMYALLVSTPQELALIDVKKAIEMYRKLNIPIVGIIENMSYFIAPDTGKDYYIFGRGKVEEEARRQKLDFLAALPLDPVVSENSDAGVPVFLNKEKQNYRKIYENVAEKICKKIF